MMTSRNILINICIILLLCLPVKAEDVPPSLFTEIIKANTGIRSVEADIVQYISTPEHSREVFKGKYIADSSGRFKINYSSPSAQVVLNDGRTIFWYYPNENVLYVIGKTNTPQKEPGINPLRELQSKDFEKQFKVEYTGKKLYGFFKTKSGFLVKDVINRLNFSIWADGNTNVLLSKVVTTNEGHEIIRETYSDYEKIQDVFFPKRIDIYAATEAGVTRNTTEYSMIRLNNDLPDTLFIIKYPNNVTKKYLQ